MGMERWRAALLVAVAIGFGGTASQAQEQYPARDIHLICGFAAGSGADVFYRYFAEKLRVLSGRTVVVENRPGAQGTLALAQVAKAKPDGYVMSLNGGTGVVSSLRLFKTPGFALQEVTSLTGLQVAPWVLVVSGNSPIKTVAELTAHLKTKGAKSSYSTSTTVGTIFGELYKSIAGLETVQVNYRTIADSLNDLTSGNIDFAMADAGFTLGQMSKGSVRPLALSTGNRMQAVPGVPTIAEAGVPGIDVSVWWSVLVPSGTPKPIVDKLDGWFAEIMKMPETAKLLAANGADVLIATPAETTAKQNEDIKRWEEYIRLAKIELQ